MIKWLENYHKRNDEKFLRNIQDSDNIEKYLSTLYQSRINISLMLLLLVLLLILNIIFLSPSDDNFGIIFGLFILISLGYTDLDLQIKVFQMHKFTILTRESRKETSSETDSKV